MHSINPKKLSHSKWTATQPKNKEKHFIITEVEFDDDDRVTRCSMQAVLTKREFEIDWRDLKQLAAWQQGWK